MFSWQGRITANKTAALASLALLPLLGGALLLPVQARAQQAREDNPALLSGILVQGSGEVQVTPDIARITLGVETNGKEASGVAQDNAKKTDALIKAVKAAGVADQDIRTSSYNISPQYDYSGQKDGKPPTISGYQATNMVTVTVRKIADTGKVIDAGVQAGGNASSGISFDLAEDSKNAAENDALAKAVAAAKRKAVTLAKAAGATNLYLSSIQESYTAPQIIRPMFASRAASDAVVATPVQPGQQTVTANVTVRFRFMGAASTPDQPSGALDIKVPLN